MGLWNRIKARLGFGDYDYYDDYDDEDEDGIRDEDDVEPVEQWGSRTTERPSSVRRIERQSESDYSRDWSREPQRLRAVPSASEVSSLSPQLKMHIVEPKGFNEAQSIADKFKQGTPVIINMTSTSPELAKRFIDFASGLTYGLDGGLQRVSEKVFMLTPTNVEVSDGDVRRMKDRGLFGGVDL